MERRPRPRHARPAARLGHVIFFIAVRRAGYIGSALRLELSAEYRLDRRQQRLCGGKLTSASGFRQETIEA